MFDQNMINKAGIKKRPHRCKSLRLAAEPDVDTRLHMRSRNARFLDSLCIDTVR